MREVFTVDVSKWQRAIDDRYPHPWFSFKCCYGSLPDPNCPINEAWSERALREGRLVGWDAYVVYIPGQVQAILEHAAMLPKGGHVKIDVESWPDSNGRPLIRGDHSDEINRLALGLMKLFPGQLIPGLPRVWRYGNRGDLDSIHPRNVLHLPTIVADYSDTQPSDPDLFGWQYTDGSTRYPVPNGWPRSTVPFGPCDHNVLYLPDPPKPAPAAPEPSTEEPDMPYIIYPEGQPALPATCDGIAARQIRDGSTVANLRAAGMKTVPVSRRDYNSYVQAGNK